MPELVPPSWLFAFGIAAMFYVAVSWFGEKHLTNEARENLTLWLWGEYQSTWLQQFCVLFDSVFGRKHLSWKCFATSSFFSILAVIFVYNLLGERLDIVDPHPIVAAALIIFGISLNMIVDFVSLLETRYVLQQFQRTNSIAGQVLILFLDIVLTGAIGLLFILGVTTIADADLPLDFFVAIIAGLSPYSIVFYSTFFTSVWAWIFVVSTWVVRLLSKRSVTAVVDVERKPHRQLALVGAAIIFAPTLALLLLLKSPNDGIDFVDEMLCTTFPKTLCTAIARSSSSDAQKRSLWQRGCAAGSGHACFYLGRDIGSNPGNGYKLEDRYYYFEQSCTLGVHDGCFYIGLAHQAASAPGFERQHAPLYFGKACDSGILNLAEACYELAEMHFSGNGAERDSVEAARLYERSCTNIRGVANACFMLGWMHATGNSVPEDAEKAIEYLRRGCAAGHIESCKLLDELSETP